MNRGQVTSPTLLSIGDVFYIIGDKNKTALQVVRVNIKGVTALEMKYVEHPSRYLFERILSKGKAVVFLRNVNNGIENSNHEKNII